MSTLPKILVNIVSATIIVGLGIVFGIPIVFSGRVAPQVFIGDQNLTGITKSDIQGVLTVYDDQLSRQQITISLRDKSVTRTVGELGISLDVDRTSKRAMSVPSLVMRTTSIQPELVVSKKTLHQILINDFSPNINIPRDATLRLAPNGTLNLVTSASGEGLDSISFERDVVNRVVTRKLDKPIELTIISAAPEILDNEVDKARTLASRLLREGMELSSLSESFLIKPFSIRRLIKFTPAADPEDPGNIILAVSFDESELAIYLSTTISPQIDQTALDARFERQENRVEVFQIPKQGRLLNLKESQEAINNALNHNEIKVVLAVDITEPQIAGIDDIKALGLNDLLASGVSDFAGSPKNRVHNINVGVSRYHGLLIPPQTEFSFNDNLGPVTGDFGWKPELVIKNNVTTPEFGGGICQVSTTAFRAAVLSGLQISQRRNHSYAVRYYGKPGFDATIYPGYTDLRFINNTPGYILIQARVEGTQVIFDFWGTNDGREVKVAGPINYDSEPNGAVKATLSQQVTRNGEVIIDDKFYSRYKSPSLFPKVIQSDDPGRAKTGV